MKVSKLKQYTTEDLISLKTKIESGQFIGSLISVDSLSDFVIAGIENEISLRDGEKKDDIILNLQKAADDLEIEIEDYQEILDNIKEKLEASKTYYRYNPDTDWFRAFNNIKSDIEDIINGSNS